MKHASPRALDALEPLLAELRGLADLSERSRGVFYRKSRAFSSARAARELGFAPVVDLRTGIRRTAEWYRSEGLL